MNHTDAIRLANEALAKHGLTAKGWRFKLNTNRSRLGVCKFAKVKRTFGGIIRIPINRIEISIHAVAMGLETFNETLLHEIAHALAGPEAKHGQAWKAVARSIGCTAQRCGVMEAPSRYVGSCACGFTAKRNRRTDRMFRLRHTRCMHSQANNHGVLTWRDASGRVVHSPQTGIALLQSFGR